MADHLGSKDFSVHLHQVFQVGSPSVLELELVEVTDKSNPQIEQFSILFAGPPSPCLQQGTYTLVHPDKAEITLFLVPLGPRDGHAIYEAVFSRLVPSNAAERQTRVQNAAV